MKKELVVVQISVVSDAAPSVTLTMVEESVLKSNAEGRPPRPGRSLMYFFHTDAPTRVTSTFSEYVLSGIKVGDRVWVEVTKLEEAAPDLPAELLESTRTPPGNQSTLN